MAQVTAIVAVEAQRSLNSTDLPSLDKVETHVDSSSPARLLGSQLRPIITAFFDDIGYKTPPRVQSDALWEAMLLKAREGGYPLDTAHSQQCFRTGYSYAAVCFPDHPLEAQVYTGLHTWLGTQIDDVVLKEDVEKFPQRFFAGQDQANPVLQGYADVLRSTFEIWDTVPANFIILSSVAFINCNVLEERAEFQSMMPTGGGRRWPHYFRDREGVPEAYSYFTFPKAKYPEMSKFLEAIPDMGRFLNLANDVISFYKEELAGVKKNYIHQRANYEGRDVTEVLKSAAKECVEAAKRVEVVLEGREPYRQAWLSHLHGYIHMHRITERYRLDEIGLAEERTCVVPSLTQETLEALERA